MVGTHEKKKKTKKKRIQIHDNRSAKWREAYFFFATNLVDSEWTTEIDVKSVAVAKRTH
jgi:hypothetical protein